MIFFQSAILKDDVTTLRGRGFQVRAMQNLWPHAFPVRRTLRWLSPSFRMLLLVAQLYNPISPAGLLTALSERESITVDSSRGSCTVIWLKSGVTPPSLFLPSMSNPLYSITGSLMVCGHVAPALHLSSATSLTIKQTSHKVQHLCRTKPPPTHTHTV